MNNSIQNLIKQKYTGKLKLVAGKGGLSNRITDCGILDYELDKSLKDKYTYSNFHEDQFILTSFLYAKNNPFLIGDAVKYLVSKGAAGIAIKNIFNLPIHESIIRYADSKDFPVFIFEDSTLFFENIVIDVKDYMRSMERANFDEEIIDTLLFQNLSQAEVKENSMKLNPSICSQFEAVYVSPMDGSSLPEFSIFMKRYNESSFIKPAHSIHKYRNGIIFLYSSDMLDEKQVTSEYDSLFNEILENGNYSVGISNPHYNLSELHIAIRESLATSRYHKFENLLWKGFDSFFHKLKDNRYVKYSSLGLYKLVLPLVENSYYQTFSNEILEPLIEFDAENKGNLFETLVNLVQCEGNIHTLKSVMDQHENTIRYRLQKITNIIGLNYRIPQDYEQLSMAVKIFIASQDGY